MFCLLVAGFLAINRGSPEVIFGFLAAGVGNKVGNKVAEENIDRTDYPSQFTQFSESEHNIYLSEQARTRSQEARAKASSLVIEDLPTVQTPEDVVKYYDSK